MKKKFRGSTLVQILTMIISLFISAGFILPVYKESASYSSNYFTMEHFFKLRPENSSSYLGIAAKFLDAGNAKVAALMFVLLFIVPVLLIVFTFPKLRKLTYFSVILSAAIVWMHLFLMLGFTIEQKKLEITAVGVGYTMFVMQLPIMYVLYVLLSIIENVQLRKEKKANQNQDGNNQSNINMNQNMNQNAGFYQENGMPVNNQFSGMPSYPQSYPQDRVMETNPNLKFDLDLSASETANVPLDSGKEFDSKVHQDMYAQPVNLEDEPKQPAPEVYFTNPENEEPKEDTEALETAKVADILPFESAEEANKSEEKPARYCARCGAKLLDNAVFCIKCGAAIDQ